MADKKGKVQGLEEQASCEKGKVQVLEEQLVDEKGKVQVLEEQLADEKGKVQVLEEQASCEKGKVQVLEEQLADEKEKVHVLEEQVQALEGVQVGKGSPAQEHAAQQGAKLGLVVFQCAIVSWKRCQTRALLEEWRRKLHAEIELLLQEALAQVRHEAAMRALRSVVALQHFRTKNATLGQWLTNGCLDADREPQPSPPTRILAEADSNTQGARAVPRRGSVTDAEGVKERLMEVNQELGALQRKLIRPNADLQSQKAMEAKMFELEREQVAVRSKLKALSPVKPIPR